VLSLSLLLLLQEKKDSKERSPVAGEKEADGDSNDENM